MYALHILENEDTALYASSTLDNVYISIPRNLITIEQASQLHDWLSAVIWGHSEKLRDERMTKINKAYNSDAL